MSAGMSAADAAFQKKIIGSGSIALILLNEEMEDIMKIFKLLEESWLLVKGIRGTMKKKKLKGGFLEGTIRTAKNFQCHTIL